MARGELARAIAGLEEMFRGAGMARLKPTPEEADSCRGCGECPSDGRTGGARRQGRAGAVVARIFQVVRDAAQIGDLGASGNGTGLLVATRDAEIAGEARTKRQKHCNRSY